MKQNIIVGFHYISPNLQTEEDYKTDTRHSEEEVAYSLKNPLQLHYAGTEKPWDSFCLKSEIWYEYLAQTNIFKEFMESLINKHISKNIPEKSKNIFSFKIPFYRRKFSLIKEKI